MKIKQVTAREIFNSKGFPAVEAIVILDDGSAGVASCPSDRPGGGFDAVEMLDHDPSRFSGHGVLKAVDVVKKTLSPALAGRDVTNQRDIDKTLIGLDGTDNKSRLGSNAIYSVSMAAAKAASLTRRIPLYQHLREFIEIISTQTRLPTPLFNLINGGKQGREGLDFYEFLIVPASSKTFDEALHIQFHIYATLQNILKLNGIPSLGGLDGGFSPKIASNHDGLSLLMQATDNTIYRLGYDIFLGIDAAASSFYKNQTYSIKDKRSPLKPSDLISYYSELVKEFHMLYIEDAMSRDDWEGWQDTYKQLSTDIMLAGDDVTATNLFRLQTAIEKKAINSVVIKPNQVGTVIEALAVVEVARAAGLKIIISDRSGETSDDFIADFAVAVGADYVKFGAMDRGEHVAKYNRLLRINEKLKSS